MPAPVKHTCPDIDKAIKKINSALKTAEYGRKSTEKGTAEHDMFNDIENDLWNLESELEDLRKANSELRDWGQEMESDLNAANDSITYLEEKILELSKEQVS